VTGKIEKNLVDVEWQLREASETLCLTEILFSDDKFLIVSVEGLINDSFLPQLVPFEITNVGCPTRFLRLKHEIGNSERLVSMASEI
jgi:hypothetical protein